MKKSIELKPCPFCKSKSWIRDENGTIWFYHRKGCWIDPLNDGVIMSQKIDLVRWNRRSSEKASS
jgi:hypothetical protein